MKLEVLRFSDSNNDTNGLLFVDGEFFAYTLEDEYRSKKVKGETRVPDGVYKLDWQMRDTPMTLRYRKRYKWFYRFLHVKNVPDFTHIYIHIGNNEKDTAGCLLVGDKQASNTQGYGYLESSTLAVERLYAKVEYALRQGEDVTIEYKKMNYSTKPQTTISPSMGSIMRFLAEKETEAFKLDEDKFFKYPIEASTYDKDLKTFYIQDAIREESKDGLEHTLTISLLDKQGKGYILKKFCKAACPVDWDNVVCAFTLS